MHAILGVNIPRCMTKKRARMHAKKNASKGSETVLTREASQREPLNPLKGIYSSRRRLYM